MSWVTTKVEAVERICEILELKNTSIRSDWVVGLLFFIWKSRYNNDLNLIQEEVINNSIFEPEGLTWNWVKEIVENYQKGVSNRKC